MLTVRGHLINFLIIIIMSGKPNRLIHYKHASLQANVRGLALSFVGKMIFQGM